MPLQTDIKFYNTTTVIQIVALIEATGEKIILEEYETSYKVLDVLNQIEKSYNAFKEKERVVFYMQKTKKSKYQ